MKNTRIYDICRFIHIENSDSLCGEIQYHATADIEYFDEYNFLFLYRIWYHEF